MTITESFHEHAMPQMATGDEEKYITTCRRCSVPLSVVSNKHGKLIAHDNHRELS
jgi:ssDNA-binding Zn-finger/Zn-ribbon topoisomerase 1